MSEIGPTVEQITAGLDAIEQAEAPASSTPAPASSAPEAAASPAEVPAAPVAEITAPAASEPTPLTLTDATVVIDPADGKPRPWGEIKAERMLRADYSRKMHAVGEMRRELEAAKLKSIQEAQAAELKAAEDALAKLPEDDPYAQHSGLLQKQLSALAKAQAAQQELLVRDAQERRQALEQAELAASQAALAAEEKRLAVEFGLPQEEIELVEMQYAMRSRKGEQVTLESIAKERKAKLAALEEAAVKSFKEKHRIGSPTGGGETSAVGTGGTPITPKSEGFAERFADDLAAIFGRS